MPLRLSSFDLVLLATLTCLYIYMSQLPLLLLFPPSLSLSYLPFPFLLLSSLPSASLPPPISSSLLLPSPPPLHLPLPSPPPTSLSPSLPLPLPLQGMLLAYCMSSLARTLLSLHSSLNKPMAKSAVQAVCKIIELLKCVQYTYHRRAMLVANYSSLIVNHYELLLLTHLEAASVSEHLLLGGAILLIREHGSVLYLGMPREILHIVIC